MTVKTLSFHCACGRVSSRVREVGLTADHELLARWICEGCRWEACALMPLADCVRECPSHEQEGSPEFLDELLESAMREVNNLDAKFLESLGVEPI